MSKCDPSSLSSGPQPSALQQKKHTRLAAPEDLRSEDAWIAYRDSALRPLEHSELVTTQATRDEFIKGCELLGLTFVFPHQLLLADVLNAGHMENGVLLPRQSAKTKTMLIIVLGRCALRRKYNVAFTFTTKAGKAHEVFDGEVVKELEGVWPDPKTRPFTISKAIARAYIAFPNGSRFSSKAPKGDDLRGSSYDLVWLDEAGECSADLAPSLLDAVLPSFMAKAALRELSGEPLPQLVATGTGGRFTTGQLLAMELKAPNGRLRYAFRDTTPGEDLESWDTVIELVREMHPGLASGLTREQDLEAYYNKETTTPESFAREVGGLFGADQGGDRLISVEDWEAAALEIDPAAVTPPARFALAYGMDRDGRVASVVGAWRDEDGNAHLLSMRHRNGTDWVGAYAHDLAQRYKVPVVYDTINPYARSEADKLERARPRTKLHPYTTREVATCAALLVEEAANGRIRHYRQPALDDAVSIATKRSMRQSVSWCIGPMGGVGDVTSLEAAALALRLYDTQTKARRAVVSTMSV